MESPRHPLWESVQIVTSYTKVTLSIQVMMQLHSAFQVVDYFTLLYSLGYLFCFIETHIFG